MVTLLEPVYMTKKGITKTQAELDRLVSVTRPELLDYLQDAKDGGDSADNTEYLFLIQEIEAVDRRIAELRFRLEHAQLIEHGEAGDVVNLGSTVIIQEQGSELESYTIVGPAEANPDEGAISNKSPLGRALLNGRMGDTVTVASPDGPVSFLIIAIS